MANYTKIEQFITRYLRQHLPKDLFYHGLHHTHDVLNFAQEIAEAENISKKELKLLKIAVLFHDAGFIKSYSGHEEVGCDLAKEYLPQFNVKDDEIELILGMIRATRIPQQPKNLLEKIIADADLMYLGTNRFKEISDTLYREMKIYFDLNSQQKWNEIQKNFIEKHKFHTPYCIKKYEASKQENLASVLASLKTN